VASERILCVDDEALSRRAIVRALRRLPNVSIDVAADTAEARALLEKHEYAVLISDKNMPGETGVELLEHAHVRHPNVIAILATAMTDMETALDAVNRGHAFGLLHKPWQLEELLLLVRQALEQHRLRRELHDKISELERANAGLAHANELLAASNKELARLYELASTDEKTGTRSYRFFVDRLEEEVARALRYEHPLSLTLLDLDGFKSVNDAHGHVAGDSVLIGVAALLSESVRVMDVVARYGGDEFALILPDTDHSGACVLSDRLRQRVIDARFDPATRGAITLSMGIASIPIHEVTSGQELVRLADSALYRAKNQGRNRCVLARSARDDSPLM
jgi:diguanylate cyclase (GGDEF)-like protein